MALIIKKRTAEATKTVSKTTATTKRILGGKRMAKESAQDKSRISLWDTNSDNERAPIARGTIQLTAALVEELAQMLDEGEEEFTLGVSLWTSDSDNERAPSFTGLIQSPSERQASIDEAKSKSTAKSSKKSTSRRRS